MTTTTTKAPADDAAAELAITELIEFEPDRLDGVKAGATGIGFLMMKAAAEPAVKGGRNCPKCSKKFDADHAGESCDKCGTKLPARPDPAAKGLPDWLAELTKAIVRGKVDETQDLELAGEIIAMLGKAIGFEAAELAAGNDGEVTDIRMLTEAVTLVKCWRAREQAVAAGQDPDESMLMCSVQVPAELAIGVQDVTKAVQAAVLAYVKDHPGAPEGPAVAKGEAAVDTVTQEALTKGVTEAVTKATKALEAKLTALQGDVAKVLALPQPGGPVLAVTQPPKARVEAEDHAAKAAYFRELAKSVATQDMRDGYEALARQEDVKAAALTG